MSNECIEAIRNQKAEYVDEGMVQISWPPTANEQFLIDHIDELDMRIQSGIEYDAEQQVFLDVITKAGHAALKIIKLKDDYINKLEAQALLMREALEIIAGKRQCLDALLGNVDIATIALAEQGGH